MSLILNIETAENVCSVALSKENKLIDIIEDSKGKNHAKLLASFVDDILKNNNLKTSDLQAVAVSKGPGSYTGLRIGVSMAKGLCYGVSIPLIAVDTLKAMANAALKKYENYLFSPMIDARRMEVYTAIYDENLNLLEPISASIINDELKNRFNPENKYIICGSGAKKSIEILNSENITFDISIQPSAKNMIEISYKKFVNKEFEDTAYFEPYYLKDFIAIKPKNKVF